MKTHKRVEPPPLPLRQERCHCWDMNFPYLHTLGDHLRRQQQERAVGLR